MRLALPASSRLLLQRQSSRLAGEPTSSRASPACSSQSSACSRHTDGLGVPARDDGRPRRPLGRQISLVSMEAPSHVERYQLAQEAEDFRLSGANLLASALLPRRRRVAPNSGHCRNASPSRASRSDNGAVPHEVGRRASVCGLWNRSSGQTVQTWCSRIDVPNFSGSRHGDGLHCRQDPRIVSGEIAVEQHAWVARLIPLLR